MDGGWIGEGTGWGVWQCGGGGRRKAGGRVEWSGIGKRGGASVCAPKSGARYQMIVKVFFSFSTNPTCDVPSYEQKAVYATMSGETVNLLRALLYRLEVIRQRKISNHDAFSFGKRLRFRDEFFM